MDFFEITPGEFMNLRLVFRISIGRNNVVIFDMGHDGFKQVQMSSERVEELKLRLGKSIELSVTQAYSEVLAQLFATATDQGNNQGDAPGMEQPDSLVPTLDKPKKKKKDGDEV